LDSLQEHQLERLISITGTKSNIVKNMLEETELKKQKGSIRILSEKREVEGNMAYWWEANH
jgi:hypothetical protein